MLFEPDLQSLGKYDLSAEEAMFQVSPNGELYIPVQNFQQSTIRLAGGMELRQVENMSDSIQSPQPANTEPESTVTCATVSTATSDARHCRLRELLNISKDAVNPQEFQDFKTFLTENHDVFALSDNELGCTNVVQHHIDTGDISPIHQQQYHTPRENCRANF